MEYPIDVHHHIYIYIWNILYIYIFIDDHPIDDIDVGEAIINKPYFDSWYHPSSHGKLLKGLWQYRFRPFVHQLSWAIPFVAEVDSHW